MLSVVNVDGGDDDDEEEEAVVVVVAVVVAVVDNESCFVNAVIGIGETT